jgi:hypothetical protein
MIEVSFVCATVTQDGLVVQPAATRLTMDSHTRQALMRQVGPHCLMVLETVLCHAEMVNGAVVFPVSADALVGLLQTDRAGSPARGGFGRDRLQEYLTVLEAHGLLQHRGYEQPRPGWTGRVLLEAGPAIRLSVQQAQDGALAALRQMSALESTPPHQSSEAVDNSFNGATTAVAPALSGHGAPLSGHGQDLSGHGAPLSGHGQEVSGHRNAVTGHGVVADEFSSTTPSTQGALLTPLASPASPLLDGVVRQEPQIPAHLVNAALSERRRELEWVRGGGDNHYSPAAWVYALWHPSLEAPNVRNPAGLARQLMRAFAKDYPEPPGGWRIAAGRNPRTGKTLLYLPDLEAEHAHSPRGPQESGVIPYATIAALVAQARDGDPEQQEWAEHVQRVAERVRAEYGGGDTPHLRATIATAVWSECQPLPPGLHTPRE